MPIFLGSAKVLKCSERVVLYSILADWIWVFCVSLTIFLIASGKYFFGVVSVAVGVGSAWGWSYMGLSFWFSIANLIVYSIILLFYIDI